MNKQLSNGPLMIGIDGGTESLRVGIFDEFGNLLSVARVPYDSTFTHPGWAEQNPTGWWEATVRAVRIALQRVDANPDQVVSIAVGATSCTVVCVASDGSLLRPAIIWMDVRAEAEAEVIAVSGRPELGRSGGPGRASAEWLLSKAMWIARNQPEVYAKTTWITEYVDYLTWRLTGRKVASLNTATIRAYYDVENGGWPAELFAAVGLYDLTEKLADTVLPMGATVGPLAPAVADALGLRASVSVVMGGADSFVAQVGLGVVNPGRVALITGSSHLTLLQTTQRHGGEGVFGPYPDAVIRGQYTLEGGQTSTGSMLAWYRHLVDDVAARTEFFETLSDSAARVPVGSNGLIILDHFQGNRTPYVDASARGALIGLSLSHGREHIYRAMIEAVCYGTENTLRRFAAMGSNIERVVVCGGAANSPLWLQTHADVSGIPLEVTRVADAVLLGGAMLGAVAAGVHRDLSAAASQMVHPSRMIEPDLDRHAEYVPFFEAYVQAYDALRPTVHFLAAAQRRNAHASGSRIPDGSDS